MSSLEELGREVAKQQDQALVQGQVVATVRAQLRDASLQPRRSVRPWVGLAAAVVFALAAAGVWRAARPIALETSGMSEGQWVSAATERSVSFTDGATVLLRSGARFQVTSLGRRGADVTLERGEASISVPHRIDTQWQFHVGPYVIHVVGTRFDTGWNPGTETFMLRLHDGAVRVSGPKIEEQKVVAGQVLEWSLAPPAAPSSAPEEAVEVPLELRGDTARVPRSLWRALAKAGRYDAALGAAKQEGWARLNATASADDVLLLGDVARLANAPRDAQSAYEAARRRFAGTASASAAAFSLGRIAFDARDDAKSARWFEQYRAERPNGALAPEALGRLIELNQRANEPTRSRQLAREYLERYPEGPHARLAQGVLGQ